MILFQIVFNQIYKCILRAYNPEAFSCDGQDYGYYADVESGCEVTPLV